MLMEYGIVQASFIPVRREPASQSEMTSQLLFGEIFEINEGNRQWLLIRNRYDGYEGWISPQMTTLFSEETLMEYEAMEATPVKDRFCSVRGPAGSLLIPAGSMLYRRKGDTRLIRCGNTFEIETPQEKPAEDHLDALEKVVGQLLNVPYLWGGKSSFGTDCSGLVQTVFRILGIPLLRDASQQVGQGKTVNMMTESRTGDLLFFDNEEGEIVHTGIMLGNGAVVHASGCVKVAAIDHQGIYNREKGEYTHRLRIIKRIF